MTEKDARWTDGRWIGPAFLGAMALLTLLFYRDFVLHPGRMLAGTDMIGEGFPLRRFALERVREEGSLPAWNPLSYGGLPYVGTLPGPLFYPTTLLYLALPLYRAIGWTFVLHTFLAGAFGYFAGRSFRLARGSSTVVGLAFAFSTYPLSTLYGGHDGRLFAMVLVPLAFGALERAFRALEAGRGATATGWSLGLGLTVAAQIMTPHTQVMYFSSLAVSLYALFRILRMRAPRGADGWAGFAGLPLRAAGLVCLAFAAAAVLGAVQLLPTLALLDHVVRAAGERGYEFAASWALPPQELTALFLPDLVGALGTYWGANPFKLHSEYMGAVPLALAAVAVGGSLGRWGEPAPDGAAGTRGARGWDRATVWFLAGASLLGVLFALGAATPVHRIAYAVVPLMKDLRAPAMMLGPVAFLVALLAGYGWERVLVARGTARDGAGGEDEPRGRAGGDGRGLPWLWIGALSALPVTLGLAAALAPADLQDFVYHTWYPGGWPRRPPETASAPLRTGGLLLVALWLLTLGVAAAVARRRAGRAALAVLLALLVVDLWRVDTRFLDTIERESVLQAGPAVERLRSTLGPGERAWPIQGYRPNELAYFGIPTVTGSQKFLLEPYARLVGGLGYDNLLRNPALWLLFDTRFVLTTQAVESPLLRPAGRQGEVRLYEVADDVPHAFFPAAVEVASDTAGALRSTLSLRDVRARAVVERTGDVPAGAAPAAGAGSATVERYAADEVVLSVEASRAGLLFLSDVHHPAWTATVDGEERPVWRVNAAFRGVEVPAGRHEVRFAYRSAAFRVGAWLSGLALLGILVALAWIGARTRGGRPAPTAAGD